MWWLLALALASTPTPTPTPGYPPLVYHPQLQVQVSEEGGIFTYRYQVHNPSNSTMHVRSVIPVFYYLDEPRELLDMEDRLTLHAIQVVEPVGRKEGDCFSGGPKALLVNPSFPDPWWVLFCTASPQENIGADLEPYVLRGPHLPVVIQYQVPGNTHEFYGRWYDAGVVGFEDEDFSEYIGSGADVRFFVLGPNPYRKGSVNHWRRWLWSLDKGQELGWFADQNLWQAIRQRAQQAFQAVNALQGDEAKRLLREIEALAQNAGPDQLHPHGRMLALYNARGLQEDVPYPCEPHLSAEPKHQVVAPGKPAEVRARLYNKANGLGIEGEQVRFVIIDGDAGAGYEAQAVTDAQGWVHFQVPPLPGELGKRDRTYQAWRVTAGQEWTIAQRQQLVSRLKAASTVGCAAWRQMQVEGSVSYLWPEEFTNMRVTRVRLPFVLSGPGRTVYLDDVTVNASTRPVPPTVTRYYISEQEELNPTTAKVLGERPVPALPPLSQSESGELTFTIPSGLRPGRLWIFACADAENQVEELYEDDNCGPTSGLVPALLAAPASQLTANLPVGVVGQAYTAQVRAQGGWAPYRFEVRDGQVPPGLQPPSDGQLGGVPTRAGRYPFQAGATDELGLRGTGESTVTVTQAGGEPIPSLGRWGLVVLALLTAAGGAIALLVLLRR